MMVIIIIIIIIAVLVTHFAYASVRLQKCLKMLHEIMFIYLKLLLITVNNNDRETCSDSLNHSFHVKWVNYHFLVSMASFGDSNCFPIIISLKNT